MTQPTPVALVTGAANRIGAAIVRQLHTAGYNVIIHYRNSADAAQALIEELNAKRADSARHLRADLADLAQVETLAQQSIAQWKRLDVLVNNASSFYPVALHELDEAEWQDLMNSNARAPLFLCKHLHGSLKASNGCIVNIVDSTALDGVSGFTPYTMAKAALANMTRSLARELAPQIRVNGVSPGAILWPEYVGGLSEEEKRQTIAHTALGRMGTPEDIAHTVIFLVRDASYITGQVIAVDGGV
jgi:pteridine reductase